MRLRKAEIYEPSSNGLHFNTYIIHGYSSYEDVDDAYLQLFAILSCYHQHVDCTMRLFRDLR